MNTKRLRYCLTSLCLTIASISVNGQYIESFSADTSRYIDELSALFGNQLTETDQLVFDQFKLNWDSAEHQDRLHLMEVSEFMRQRKCRPRPHYIEFLEIINTFLANPSIDPLYDGWIRGYKRFMSNETTLYRDIKNINRSTLNIIDDRKIFESVSVQWYFRKDNYDFVYEDGFKLETRDNDLICISGGDSIKVLNVIGHVDLLKQRFYGSNGLVTWERAGYLPSDLKAELGEFTIELTEPGFTADSVVAYYPALLDAPAAGRLEDRVSQIREPGQARYPKFYTYKTSYNLEDFIKGINYSGGLSIQGANLAGTGIGDQKASLEVFSEDTLRLLARSDMFLLNPSTILSNHAIISIYLGNDSIYHPDLILNYNVDQDLLRLSKSDDYNSQGPYSDSYHNVDMMFQELRWNRKEPEMRFQAALGSSMGNASFESYDFFNMEFYISLQGMDWQHPLAELWAYGRLLRARTFPAESYAINQGKDIYIIRHQLMEFSRLGFVYYDFEKDEVTLRDKLYDYIDASLQKRDYDVMRFISRTTGQNPNARLNVHTRDLEIFGIPAIFLSDSQNVKLVPTDNRIVMKRNRNFQFDGIIDAGLFKFYGKNFFFEYDNFRINLQNIDSLSMSALTGERDGMGNPLVTTIDNKIENITGELLIDAPFNKSGLLRYPEYPIFSSEQSSYIYFDEKTIQNGVYDRDRFYFKLDPFNIDSLDNFSRDNISLAGTFTSANVLPDLDMEMTLRPDNSLGFYMTTPSDGLPLFGGRAKFFNDIEMSSRGLRGYGSFDYLTSTTWSDDFLFHPDSMTTTSRRFLTRERREAQSFPYVENTIADISYYPFDDELHIRRMEELFNVFDEETKFSGRLLLKPEGLRGDGALGFEDARFESEVFAFESHRFNADSAGVQLRPGTESDFNFITNNVGIRVDLDQRKGRFGSIDDYTLVEFPENLYETRVDQMEWLMDKDEVILTQHKQLISNLVDIGIDSLRTTAPAYVSKHPRQDSLHFASSKSTFFYTQNRIEAQGVKFIEVGDAYVFPHDQLVEVRAQARMATLENSKLLANKETRHHMMHSASLDIDSRHHFKGEASYDYVDETGEVYTFKMSSVEVDTSIETRGFGEVVAEDGFQLSPYFAFRGMIHMNAKNPLLDFRGGTRPIHDCQITRKKWLKFESRLNPDSLLIPVGDPMIDQNLRDLFAGTLIARDSVHIYPTFASSRKNYFDRNISYSSGYLYYNKRTQDFEMAELEKLKDHRAMGNLLRLETDSCRLYGEGRLGFPLTFGQVKMKATGNAYHDIESNELDLRLLLGFDFLFNNEALQIFGNEIDSIANLQPVDLTSSFYQQGILNLVGEETAGRLATELGLTGEYEEIPDSLNFTILFNDLPLKWNQETRSFRLNGKAGIGIIGGVQVNKKVDAYFELVERGSGDVFDLYLSVDPETWYYFAYSPGGLQVLSSNQQFNQVIMDLPERDRRIKGGVGRPSYVYSVSSARRMQLFLDRFMLNEPQ